MNIVRRQEPSQAPVPAASWDPFRMMREMMRWDPFREMTPLLGGEPMKGMFVPDVDVKELGNAYVFRADVPGIKDKDVEIQVSGNRLTLSGKREEEKQEEKGMFFTSERLYGSFTRSFTLPPDADLEHVAAELKDGVLSITVAKRAEAQPKKIPVGSASKPKS